MCARTLGANPVVLNVIVAGVDRQCRPAHALPGDMALKNIQFYLGCETEQPRLEPVTGRRTQVVVWRGREVVKGKGGGTGKKGGKLERLLFIF